MWKVIIYLKASCPAVSQICSLICFPSIVIMRAPNSTPMVRSCTGWNLLSVNWSNRHDLPTPDCTDELQIKTDIQWRTGKYILITPDSLQGGQRHPSAICFYLVIPAYIYDSCHTCLLVSHTFNLASLMYMYVCKYLTVVSLIISAGVFRCFIIVLSQCLHFNCNVTLIRCGYFSNIVVSFVVVIKWLDHLI